MLHSLIAYRPYQNLEKINHNLHDHVFVGVICKPLIDKRQNLSVTDDCFEL